MGLAKFIQEAWNSIAHKKSQSRQGGNDMPDESKSNPVPQSSPPVPVTGTGANGDTPGSKTSATPGAHGRTLLIHGYSADGEDLIPWQNALHSAGVDTVSIEIGNYITLNNEVTIKDLGEAFDRALRLTEWSTSSLDDNWTFDAVVHSTGMLVIRQWLTSDPYDRDDPRSRIRRLKHLVGLAPATFGSPQAKQGRSWLGALVKGNKHLGPDFLNAGNRVLDGLELASSYTWELTHNDLLCEKPLFDMSPNTPYVTVFIGNTAYEGVEALANSPGSDGTVRWAGCALNTRKVSLDLRRETKLKDGRGDATRCSISPWVSGRLPAPMIAVDCKNHGSIVKEPDPEVAARMKDFFSLTDQPSYQSWEKEALAFGAPSLEKMNAASLDGAFGGAGWQQLVVHVIDDHGDGVTDYNLQLFIGESLAQSDDPTFAPVPLIVDTYSGDNSYRCFYIRISPEMLALNAPGSKPQKMWLELIASSGSPMIEYEAYTGQTNDPQRLTIDHSGGKPVKLDITALAQGDETLLYPYTTTFLEISVEREPLPLGTVSQLFNFLGH